MATIFFNFNLDSKVNLVDDLLSNFQRYERLKKSSHLYFKEYCYPDIVLSEDEKFQGEIKSDYREKYERDAKRYDCDCLGFYEYDNAETKEGRIYLFYNSIYDIAEEYKKDVDRGHACPDDLKDNIENLATIVLIHEFVHWVMLWVINTKQRLQGKKEYKEKDHYLYFHEGFAQLFTLFVIERKQRDDLRHLFEWLAKKQSPEYRKYQELKNKGFDSIEKAVSFLNILAELDKPIDYWEACVGPHLDFHEAFTSLPESLNIASRLRKGNEYIYTNLRNELTPVDQKSLNQESLDVAADLGDYGF